MARKKKTTTKARTTTRTSTTKGTRCSTPNCKKRPKKDSDLCTQCYDAAFPSEAVQTLDVVEALQFSALDTVIRNHTQGVRILDLERVQAQQAYNTLDKERESVRQQLLAAIEAKRTEYVTFIQTLATKYNMDPKQMTVDAESRVIRDLRESTVEPTKP